MNCIKLTHAIGDRAGTDIFIFVEHIVAVTPTKTGARVLVTCGLEYAVIEGVPTIFERLFRAS